MDAVRTEIRPASEHELVWFCRTLGYAPGVDIKGIVREAHVSGGRRLLVMAGFDHWTEGSCEMHIWVSSDPERVPPVNRVFIRECLNYVFSSGRSVIIGRTPSDNKVALDFSRRIGFVVQWRCVGAHTPDVDLMFQDLTPVRALNWFPDHVIDRYYRGVPWLEKAKKALEMEQRSITWNPADLRGLSTRTPPSSLAGTSKRSFTPWPRGARTREEEKAMLREAMAKERDRLVELYRKQMRDPGWGSGLAGSTSSSTTGSPSGIPESKS